MRCAQIFRWEDVPDYLNLAGMCKEEDQLLHHQLAARSQGKHTCNNIYYSESRRVETRLSNRLIIYYC